MLIRTVQGAMPVAVCTLALLLPTWLQDSHPVVLQAVALLPWLLLCTAWGVSRLFGQPKVSFILLVSLLSYSVLQLYLNHLLTDANNELMIWLMCLMAPPLILTFQLIPDAMAGESSNWKCYLLVAMTLGLGAMMLVKVPEPSEVLLSSLPGMESGSPPLAGLILLATSMMVPLFMMVQRSESVDLVALMALLGLGFGVCGFRVPTMPEVAFSAVGLATIVLLLLHSYHLAFFDTLTGLRNRRSLESMLNDLPRGFHLAIADVDHFKQFNDTYGHEVGDEVLKLVAQLLAEVQCGGRVYRLGGEEFVILFGSSCRGLCANALDRLRRRVAEYPFYIRRPLNAPSGEEEDRPEQITISLGLVQQGIEDRHLKDVLRRADAALYRAKARGRNCLVVDDGRTPPWTVIGRGHTLP
ncbi:GGDEF domain-containing protein [Ferrimonas sediminicola]|uniref:diguanylate cyclase n=1 Tax=Ferrimonas sediminicola TaxID=2569538 RepID=A0A4U1BCY6_9GAMM|nr:GGDEF domain-containing protein [Ferrimonas sediminicola]TKB48599.1 GGDEF domain-containing protein [Ferrimonas sediminicola]